MPVAWEPYVIGLIVVWAIGHSYMDYRLTKRVEALERKAEPS
jgi:hypothetical protein